MMTLKYQVEKKQHALQKIICEIFVAGIFIVIFRKMRLFMFRFLS